VVAYLAGDYAVARAQMEALHWEPVRNNLTAWGVDLSLLPQKVGALTGKSAEQVKNAESKYSQGDLATPLKIYAELSASADADGLTREYSRCRLAALQQEALLAKGEWMDLMPTDEKDPNWVISVDKMRRLPDGALEIESGPKGHLLYSRTRVGTEFEVKGEFEMVRSSTSNFQAGVVMGLPDNLKSDWYSFRMKSNPSEGQLVSFSRTWGVTQLGYHVKFNEGTNSFRFCWQKGKVDIWLNGVQYMRQTAPLSPVLIKDNCMLGLGAFNDSNDTVIRYRNVKVRRL
jgi:hypothetical protein